MGSPQHRSPGLEARRPYLSAGRRRRLSIRTIDDGLPCPRKFNTITQEITFDRSYDALIVGARAAGSNSYVYNANEAGCCRLRSQ